MSESKSVIGDFQKIDDLCMDHFQIREEIWGELSEKAKKILIENYMTEKKPGRAGQPDQERFCEHTVIKEGRLVECDRPSEYRVSLYSDVEVLNQDDEWEKERREEYLCENHYQRKYIYNEYKTSKDLGSFSYKRFITKITKEEIELRKKARRSLRNNDSE